ncbi:YDG domain-containing protein, partial [Succiniclasticum ruminis]
KNAGTNKTVTVSGATISDGNEGGNYNVTYADNTASTINPKAITASFADISKVYDGTTNATAGEGTLDGVVEGDTGKVSVTANAAYDEKNAGNRTVNYTGVTLTDEEAGNYSIAETATGAGTITAKEITASFADISKVYDGTTTATAGERTLDGVVDGDKGKVEVTASATYDSKDAGNRIINYTGVELSGAEAANYTIARTLTGKGTINRKALELVADPASTEYGDYNPASFTGRVDGFVAGESVSSGDSLLFALSDPSASAVGSYGITGTINGSASGEYGLNYTFTNAASNENAFTIYARPASVQDMVLSDIIPGIKGKPGADISATALDNAMEQARDKRAEVGIEFAVAQTILSVDADKTLSLENQGMKKPPSMTAQEVAEQVHAQQTDNATGTEESKRKKGAA